MTTPLFELKDVCKTFRIEGTPISVLSHLNLSIQHGEWIALTGPSGCGKSTLLHLLGNLDKPSSGTVMLDGVDINKLWAWQQAKIRMERIGFIFQAYHLFPELNALENVTLPARKWFAPKNDCLQRATELLTKFGLKDRMKHRPQELSGGEQQRVAIARALLNNPDIILADEPTGNLDYNAGNDIIEILQQLHRDEGKTIIMVTHDMRIAGLAQKNYIVSELNQPN